MSANKRQVRWAKGLAQKEKAKMTGFTAGKLDSIYVSGISIAQMDFSHLRPIDKPKIQDDILISIINCHGDDNKRYFTIPLNKVDEICDALQVVKKQTTLATNGVKISPK
jgi:hypothetical protein